MSYLNILVMGFLAFCFAAFDPVAAGAIANAPTITPKATTKPVCNDLSSRCPVYAQRGDCTGLGGVKEWMKKNCPKACGHCPPGCYDYYPRRCPKYGKRGYCTSWAFKGYMKALCRKTCDFCGGPTTPPPMPPCEDIHEKCGLWKNQNFCDCESVLGFCKASCGLCDGATVRPPITQNKTCPDPSPLPGDCGKPAIQQSRVIAGEDAKRGAWPWQILMLRRDNPNCGGSIIAPNWVLTAAHCVYGKERHVNDYKLRAGEHDFSTIGDAQHQDLRVSKIISHPDYNRSITDNDIALMKLRTPVMFGKYVKPVCLPKQDQDVPVGTECYITGWGKIRHPGSMHSILQQGKMPVVSSAACAIMNIGRPITEQMICAGHGGKTRVSGCHGDSGGPFVCKTGSNGQWVLHGAVSWGSGRCDATERYTVFARIARFRAWIDDQMANN